MKTISLFILTFIAVNIYAQKKEFIRVYDLNGKKISKGNNYVITDSTIECNDNGKIFSYSEIGFIRTKRSFGHNVGVGSLIGFASAVILFSASNVQSEFFAKGMVVAFASIFVGAPSGTIGGIISNLFKKSNRYDISGDFEKWKKFRHSLIKSN